MCVCDQCLHQPILVVLHFRGVLQSGQCCSPGALLGDVLLLTITLHHAPSGYHWFVIIAFFSSVGLIQSFSPGDFSVCFSVGLTGGVCVLVGTEHWGKREGVLKQTCCSVIFSCFLSFSIWLCGPTLSCWMLILTPASTDVPIQRCYIDSEARRAAHTMLTAWGFELAAVRVLKKEASQLWGLVSVDSSDGSAELEVTNLNLQYFSSR